MNTKTKQLRSFPGYEIYNDGRIYSLKTNKFLLAGLNSQGYKIVCLMKDKKKVMKRVSHLVCQAFKRPRKPGETTDHLDENKLNNNDWNVCWCSRKVNIKRYWERRKA